MGPSGEQVGIVRIEVALSLAAEADLDLVEVAPDARPPVARLMDYGKFKYESAMKARDVMTRHVVSVGPNETILEAGELMFLGQGAGGNPTASAVMGDVVTVARNRARGTASHLSSGYTRRAVAPIGESSAQLSPSDACAA